MWNLFLIVVISIATCLGIHVCLSVCLSVHGGVPQGSVLGVLFFNIVMDDLEDPEEDAREFVQTSSEGSLPSSGAEDGALSESSLDILMRSNLDPDAPAFTPGEDWSFRGILDSSSNEDSGLDDGEPIGSPAYAPSAENVNLTDHLLHENADTSRPPPWTASTPQRPGGRGRPRWRQSPIHSRGPRLTAETGVSYLEDGTGGDGVISRGGSIIVMKGNSP